MYSSTAVGHTEWFRGTYPYCSNHSVTSALELGVEAHAGKPALLWQSERLFLASQSPSGCINKLVDQTHTESATEE